MRSIIPKKSVTIAIKIKKDKDFILAIKVSQCPRIWENKKQKKIKIFRQKSK